MSRRRRHLRTKRATPRAGWAAVAPPICAEAESVMARIVAESRPAPGTKRLLTTRPDPTDRILAESQPVHDTVKRTDDPDIERAQWAAVWSKP